MEFLKKLLGDELFATVAAKLGDTKLLLDDGSYVAKKDLDDAVAQRDAFKGQVEETGTKMKELEGKLKDIPNTEKLQSEIQALQEGKTKAEAAAADISLNSAIKLAAVKAKANDAADILAFIDKTTLTVEGEDVKGLDEAIKGMQESKPYLFAEQKEQTGGGANPAGGGNVTPADEKMLAEARNAVSQ